MIVYEGKSKYDGNPVVVILTGLNKAASNAKTGDMVQSWILRSDIYPKEAVITGEDFSICGNCFHRGEKRTCYVKMLHGPIPVYNAYKRGIYPKVSPDEASLLLENKLLRIGSYGDPAVIPFSIWETLVQKVKGWTGYTHSRENLENLSKICMISVDSLEESLIYQKLGYRTFRVGKWNEKALPTEILCPASKEFFDQRGYKMQCSDCLLCSGKSKARSVFIADHSTGAVARKRNDKSIRNGSMV